jgi:hypothetical protein
MPPSVAVRVTGLDTTGAALARLLGGVRAAGASAVLVGSAVEYAPVQEQRRGYLAAAKRAVERSVAPALARALPLGAEATDDAMDDIGRAAVRTAQAAAPVRTGMLRRSLRSQRSRPGLRGG